MEKMIINSFGNLVIPSSLRKEMGIVGSCTLWLDIRTDSWGEKEIVVKKTNDLKSILDKYQTWAEVVSRISEYTVSLVYDNKVLSISDERRTESFADKNILVNPLLHTYLKNATSRGTLVTGKDIIHFLPNAYGDVVAFYNIGMFKDNKLFLVILRGTKADKSVSISKPEMLRRFNIINDIVDKI